MAVKYVNSGINLVVDRIDGTATPDADYIGSGTGAGSFVAGTIALFTEVSEARVSATKSQPASDKNQWLAVQPYTGTKTITNAGVLDSSGGSDLIIGADSLSIAVVNGDSIQFTITLQQT